MSCKSKKVEAAGRGPFLFPTYLGRSTGLCSQGTSKWALVTDLPRNCHFVTSRYHSKVDLFYINKVRLAFRDVQKYLRDNRQSKIRNFAFLSAGWWETKHSFGWPQLLWKLLLKCEPSSRTSRATLERSEEDIVFAVLMISLSIIKKYLSENNNNKRYSHGKNQNLLRNYYSPRIILKE